MTPHLSPDSANDSDWCFPDTEAGILAAISQGATHLWANTILFATHPLQTSATLGPYEDSISVIGQPPKLVEGYDDKAVVYRIMKENGGISLPTSITVEVSQDCVEIARQRGLEYPVIAKPVRGRGSHGVKLCQDASDLQKHAAELFAQSPKIIIEEYLAGEEATVTVMPPSQSHPVYWTMPVVRRFNHLDGIAPYSGVVAVSANSCAVSEAEAAMDPAYGQVADECAVVAKLLKTTAPIRIDVRRYRKGGPFALFDVNMKPVG